MLRVPDILIISPPRLIMFPDWLIIRILLHKTVHYCFKPNYTVYWLVHQQLQLRRLPETTLWFIDGNPISYGPASVATPNSSLFTRTVLNWATPVNIVTKFKVTKDTTYTITVQARTMEGQASGVYGGYVGTYESNGLTAPSSMTGALIPD